MSSSVSPVTFCTPSNLTFPRRSRIPKIGIFMAAHVNLSSSPQNTVIHFETTARTKVVSRSKPAIDWRNRLNKLHMVLYARSRYWAAYRTDKFSSNTLIAIKTRPADCQSFEDTLSSHTLFFSVIRALEPAPDPTVPGLYHGDDGQIVIHWFLRYSSDFLRIWCIVDVISSSPLRLPEFHCSGCY